MQPRPVRAVATMAALATLTAGPFVVGTAATAYAQNTVTTQDYLIGNGPVSDATAVAQPNTAGDTANYTIGFVTPSALSGGTATVTLTDPSNSTIFPSNRTSYFVIDNSSAAGDQRVSGASLADNGHSVTLQLTSDVGAGSSLSLYIVGATNPGAAGQYSLDVSTSANPVPEGTADYQVVAAASAPAFAPVAAPPLAGSAATYTVGAFKASAALKPGSWVKISSSAGSGTTDNVRFPTVAGDYKVNDLTTTSSSAAPAAVNVYGAGAGRSGQAVYIKLADAIAAGDELSLTVSGVQNPSGTQTDTVTAAAPDNGAAFSADLVIGTSVINPTISLSQASAGASGVEYTIGFKSLSAISAGGSVTLTAPAGTSFGSAAVTLLDVSNSAVSANIPASAVKATSAGSSTTANELSFTVPNAIAAGDELILEIDGATNPPAGNYGGPTGDFTIATAGDIIPTTVPSYSVTAAPAPMLATIEISTTAPGATADYNIGDLKATSAFTAGSSTIELHGPSGTVLPGSTSGYDIADLTNKAASANPSAISGGGTADVTLTVASDIASGDFVEIVANDVTNPASGSYSMAVLGNLQAAVPPAPVPPVPPKPVHHPVPAWPRYLTSGSLLRVGHRWYVVVARSVRPVTEARILVAYRVRSGHHVRIEVHWSYRVHMGAPMGRHLIEFRFPPGRWVRWNGHLYHLASLSQV
ncbi:MAG TPA: hypothetical protein VME46_19495 [Acidimicrobiales bacterium]|nr:hypothetical protein [Acidimicrobiales bacterium]